MAAVSKIDLSGDRFIDGLLSGPQWDATNLTFSFPAKGSYYGVGYGDERENTTGFAQVTAAQKSAIRDALDAYESIANLSFTEIGETGTRHADLRFAKSDAPSTAWAYTPGTYPEAGDVWFNNRSGTYDSPRLGNYAYQTILHEIGHALGLDHPHESGMPVTGDALEFSVMSYRSYVGQSLSGGYTNDTWSFPQSLMMHDIAALQHMYGADYTTNRTNTTYRWSPATGEKYVNGSRQGAPGENKVFETIWDGGGIDTFDFSAYRVDLEIDLRPGESSILAKEQLAELGGARRASGNVYNALLHEDDVRSLIENAIAGTGDDSLVGNQARNVLTGGTGDDDLLGLQGSDRLVGNIGDDLLVGGIGNDILAGGGGHDAFEFEGALGAATNLDRILDFSVAHDTILLENAVFRGTGASTFAAAAFHIGAAAHDESDRIIYNRATGSLLYDPDGTGPQAAVKFCQLAKGLALTRNDFDVV